MNKLKKKLSSLIAFLLFPTIASAAGYGGAEGRNRLGERIHIGSDSYYELYIIRGPGNGIWSEPFDMNVECPEFKSAMIKGRTSVFSCPAGRKFPLSGTTYRITTSSKYRPCESAPYFDKSPGTIYLCINGCNSKTAPTLFKESPWEC